jgi:hypothetical protein
LRGQVPRRSVPQRIKIEVTGLDAGGPRGPGLRAPSGRSNRRLEVAAVFVRVVRFTDVNAERVDALLARVDADGPPPGVPITGLKLLFDKAQGTAVVLQYLATAGDMAVGAQAFNAMDASETPGTRASVDMCELKLERTLT